MTGVASYGSFVSSSIASIPSGGTIKRGTADEFITDMLKLGLRYRHFCLNPKPMVITAAQEKEHQNAESCFLCGIPKVLLIKIAKDKEAALAAKLEAKMKDKESASTGNLEATVPSPKVETAPKDLEETEFVRYHDHVTGLYRGAACGSCNVKAQMPKQIPIFFHNLESFDSHELVNAIVRMRAVAPSPSDSDDEEDDQPQEEDFEAAEMPNSEDNFETGEITITRDRIANMRFNILANSTEKYMQLPSVLSSSAIRSSLQMRPWPS